MGGGVRLIGGVGRKNRRLEFLYSRFLFMNFGVEGLANSISIGGFWSMAFGVEGIFYFSVVGRRVSNFFKDFAIHEIVRICKILQTL